MFERQATVRVPAPVERVYNFLRTRYSSTIYRDASLVTKGYLSPLQCLEEKESQRLVFRAPARDPVLRIFLSGWTWEYDLHHVSDSETEVTIRYTYGLFMALLGMGTMGLQAANAIVATASTLEALAQQN